MARVYHFNYRKIYSGHVVSRRVGLVEARGRTEERLSEPEAFEFEENLMILVLACVCGTLKIGGAVVIVLILVFLGHLETRRNLQIYLLYYMKTSQ